LIGGAELLTGGGQSYQAPQSGSSGPSAGAPTDPTGQFVASVLRETEDRWKEMFEASGKSYQAPKLVMFSGATRSACGAARSAMGPFYCPLDQQAYLDTSFFKQLESCDVGSKARQFSQVYVIAHEVGHHVQNLLGILPKPQQAQRGVDTTEANEFRSELSCRPTASLAYGQTVHSSDGSSSNQATSTPPCRPRQP
jgi:predicted metalloprotease